MTAGFLVSGLVHELVISVPAGGGFGGPTLFFAAQGVAMSIERSMIGRAIGLGRGWRGWVFAAAVVVAPACILFHAPFVRKVIGPMLENWGRML
jgi:alginate O-acetyltransferase complex protein AlgI